MQKDHSAVGSESVDAAGAVSPTPPSCLGSTEGALFDAFPYGLALIGGDRRVLRLNRRARSILLFDEPRPAHGDCCGLLCGRAAPLLGARCLSSLALAGEGDLPEVRIDIDGRRLQSSAWVTASALGPGGPVLLHLRPGRPGDRRRRTRQGWHGDSRGGARAELRMTTLGPFSIEAGCASLDGEWTGRRAGQLLKFLVCHRRTLLMPDQIAEALWPDTGPEEARNRLRFQIHTLRRCLEPDRAEGAPFRHVRSRHGGYLLDTGLLWVDVDEYEREARAGLAALRLGDAEAAAPHLTRAAALYRGPFIAEEPYAEWAIEERERLRELAVAVLRHRAEYLLAQGDVEGAMGSARHLVETDPYDPGAQRLFLGLILERGGRGEAVRRYELYRARLRRTFDTAPDFDLSTLGVPAARSLEASTTTLT